MNISELIELLESEMEREGDMEIVIYDSHGDQITPNGIRIGCVARGIYITDYAYISDLD